MSFQMPSVPKMPTVALPSVAQMQMPRLGSMTVPQMPGMPSLAQMTGTIPLKKGWQDWGSPQEQLVPF